MQKPRAFPGAFYLPMLHRDSVDAVAGFETALMQRGRCKVKFSRLREFQKTPDEARTRGDEQGTLEAHGLRSFRDHGYETLTGASYRNNLLDGQTARPQSEGLLKSKTGGKGKTNLTSSLFWRGAEQQLFFCVAYHRGN
jgi:hypothetical protein